MLADAKGTLDRVKLVPVLGKAANDGCAGLRDTLAQLSQRRISQ